MKWRFGPDIMDIDSDVIADIEVLSPEASKDAWIRYVHPKATHLLDPALAYYRDERTVVWQDVVVDGPHLLSKCPSDHRPTHEDEILVFWSANRCARTRVRTALEVWEHLLYPGGSVEFVVPERKVSMTIINELGTVAVIHYWPYQRRPVQLT